MSEPVVLRCENKACGKRYTRLNPPYDARPGSRWGLCPKCSEASRALYGRQLSPALQQETEEE